MSERTSKGVKHQKVRAKQALSRVENGHLKRKERGRKDARMVAAVKAGSLPFTPAILSWLSTKLNKRSSLIKQEDLAKIK
jgi:hypothetical protein